MKSMVYLLRHATADARSALLDDADRCLNEKGRLQARRVAAFMQKHQLIPGRILCSPYSRTVQTAAIVRKDLALTEAVSEQLWLVPGAVPADMASETKALLQDGLALLIAGHEPELALLLKELLGAGSDFIELKKASLTCLEFDHSSERPVKLAWSVPARLMG